VLPKRGGGRRFKIYQRTETKRGHETYHNCVRWEAEKNRFGVHYISEKGGGDRSKENLDVADIGHERSQGVFCTQTYRENRETKKNEQHGVFLSLQRDEGKETVSQKSQRGEGRKGGRPGIEIQTQPYSINDIRGGKGT